MTSELPRAVVAGLGPGVDAAEVIAEDPIDTSSGAATGSVTRLTLRVEGDLGTRTVVILRKALARLQAGPHAPGAADLRHWAYWRREADAYASGLLPDGPGLRAPRCYAVVGEQLYLEAVVGGRPTVTRAAQLLADWQRAREEALDRPWMCSDQLAARVAVSAPDWAATVVDERMRELWARRDELLAELGELPRVLSHGDYSIGNLMSDGDDVVALDWATLGWEPVGFDLAHLALSTGEDPVRTFVESAAPSAEERSLLGRGFSIAVALVGSSRAHWMAQRDIRPPSWYTDFVWQHRPLVL